MMQSLFHSALRIPHGSTELAEVSALATIVLAQLTPEMLHGLPGWLVCAGAVLWIYNEARKAFRRRPPNEELGASHLALSERVARTESSIQTLYQRTEAVATTCAQLETATELQTQRLAQIDAKLDRLIERRHS